MQLTLNGPGVNAAFIPFEKMTARQQAEHLVLAHGMGADYHGDLTELGLPSDGTDTDLITWHEGLREELLVEIHTGDHDYLADEDNGALLCRHTHTKGA